MLYPVMRKALMKENIMFKPKYCQKPGKQQFWPSHVGTLRSQKTYTNSHLFKIKVGYQDFHIFTWKNGILPLLQEFPSFTIIATAWMQPDTEASTRKVQETNYTS